VIIFCSAANSQAALVLMFNKSGNPGPDAEFENYDFPGGVDGRGFLAAPPYNLPQINTAVSGPPMYAASVLPQVERAVAQISSNTSARGLYVPSATTSNGTSGSGIPGVANFGNQSAGVIRPFTNYSVNTNSKTIGAGPGFSGNFSMNFEYKRVSNVVSFTLSQSGNSTTWTSLSESYFDQINAIEIRIRSTSNNSLSITNLNYSDEVTPSQDLSLGSPILSGSGTAVTIAYYEGITGNFSLTGTYNFSGTGTWNSQIKGLAIPEPTTAALAALAMGGLLLRRRSRN
jgi:hypothetical protein